MKMMKKLATLLLAICLVVPCFSMVSFAADGKIMFTDPSTKVGETLEVTGVVAKSSGNFGKIEITMTYDTTYLKFKSGDGIVEDEAGEITYTGDATHETGSRKEFKITFDVLKAGTTKLQIKNATIKNVAGAVLDYTKGSSTITIAEGEGTTATDPVVDTPSDVTGASVVDVNGKTYTISNTIPTNAIPEGYVASTLEYDLVKYNVVYSESFGLYLAYMYDSDNVGGFFMYVEEDATFAPYEEITISDDIRIALLSDVSEIELPDEYVSQDVMSANGYEFPAWKNEENPDFIVLYAINNNGEKSLYQLDNAEGTYQRFNAPEVVHEELNNTFIGKLSDLLENHLDYVILGTGIGFILFVIIIVILSVKLYNRNAELDEIYDEYGLDDEDDDESDSDYEEIDYENDYDDDEDEDDEDGDKEMEMLVQAGMKEVFPEDDEEEDEVPLEVEKAVEEKVEEETIKVVVPTPAQEVISNTVEIPIEKVAEKIAENEDTLGAALAKQKEAANEEGFLDDDEDDDDDILENFSMDFIDLDD